MTQKNLTTKKFIIFCILYLFLLGVGYFYYGIDSKKQLSGDEQFYDKTGLSISRGQGYSLDGKPTAAYQIGYPLFLAGVYTVFGHNYKAVLGIQVILSLITFILFLIFSLRINGPLYFIPLLLYCSNYIFIYFTYSLMSEALAVFLFAASIFLLYLFLKTGKRYIIFLLGLGYGYLTLVRPVFELYPLLLLLVSFYFLKNRNYKNFANFWIFFISFLLVIAPYSYRNYRKFGSVKLSAAGTLALYWGLTHKPIDLSQFNNGNPINYGALASSDKIKSIDKALFKDTLDSIKKHPFKTSLNYLKNIERLLFYSPFNKEEPLSLQRKILSLLNILSFIAMFSGLCFIIIKRVGVERVSGSILFFCYSMLFYYVFISGFLVTNPRYGLYPVFLIYLLSPVILKFYKPKIRH